MLPIMTSSQQTIVETEQSQGNLLARQYLIDLMERFRGSDLDELRAILPDTEEVVPLGEEPVYLRDDVILSDKHRVLEELEALAASGYNDGGRTGFQRLVNTTTLIKLTGAVWFREDATAPGVHELVCKVRWLAPNGTGEKSLTLRKVLLR